jgi:hypothetical protein
MSDRRNTLVCVFDPASPRISAFDIHEWIHAQLHVVASSVIMIQIDGLRRQVFIKFTALSFLQDILHTTNGETIYKYVTGEIYPVRLMIAAKGIRRIRLANLPPEMPNDTIRTALKQCGDIQSINDEQWATHYRYPVSNGIKSVIMSLHKHIPSHITIDGYRALTSYDGQPQTCYGCGNIDHMYNACPKRRVVKTPHATKPGPTWAQITANIVPQSGSPDKLDDSNMDMAPGYQHMWRETLPPW